MISSIKIYCMNYVLWDEPIDSVTGITNSSGTGPGIAEGLQQSTSEQQRLFHNMKEEYSSTHL